MVITVNNIEKQARQDVFNSLPKNVQMVFRNADIYGDITAFLRLVKAMANLAFGDVNAPSIVTNQSDDFEFANGIDFHYENGRPIFKGV